MKKVLAFLLSAYLITPAFADGHGIRHGHGHRDFGYGWVAPAIIGGVIGYELARPRIVDVTPPAYNMPPPGVYTLPPPPYGYHYENILDRYCNCYRTVLVLN